MVPQLLHNWAEATERVDHIVQQIQEKVKRDYDLMMSRLQQKQ